MKINALMLKYVIPNEYDGRILRDYLYEKLKFSTRLIKKAKGDAGKILINGTEQTVRYMLQPGDVLQIEFPPEEKSESVIAENIPLTIVYEDSHLLIVNKLAGMPTIP